MNNQFSDNLKKIRKEHNLSQEELAEELGVSRQAISKWESGSAYPEMDKIIALCDKFNLNIDDLLHKNIKEVKGEEESKKKINNFVDDFLKYITNTINMFSNMTFKSKIKCLFEQAIIIFVLFLVSVVGVNLLNEVVRIAFAFLPFEVLSYIINIFESVFILFFVIASIIVLTHVFKTRYLDYYLEVKKEKISELKEDKEDDEPTEGVKEDKRKEKVSFDKKEDKIIIRDPKHSEYRFIKGLFKVIIGFVKFFSLFIALFVIFALIGLLCLFIASFLLYKTGFLFIGLLISILSACVISVIFLLLILNFVFNRKNNKKLMIWTFIVSVITFGIGCGLIFLGTINLDLLDDTPKNAKVETIEYNMTKDFAIEAYTEKPIVYIEENIDNIRVEYTVSNYCSVHEYNIDNHLFASTDCENPMKIIREFAKNANNKRIIEIGFDIYEVKVYASKENIKLLKENQEKLRTIDEEIEE
jgi:transcriptional regulator with XRE-family HTH domain